MTSTAELARAEPGSLTGALRPWSLFACSGLVLMLALLVPAAPIGIIVLGAAAGHFATGGLIWAARLRQSVVRFLTFRRLRKQAAEDAAPVLLTNRAGRLLFANPSAVSLGAAPSGSAASVLRPYIASADSLAERLTVAASLTGDAVEDVATRTHVMRVRVRVAAENLLAWRLEQIDRTAALKVLSGAMPALSLTEDGAVEYANPAAQNQLGDIAKVAGPLPDLPGHRAVSLPGFGGRQDIIFVPQGLGSSDEDLRYNQISAPGVGVLDGLPVPVLEIAVDGAITAANAHARQLLSLSDGPPPPLYDLVEGMGRPIS